MALKDPSLHFPADQKDIDALIKQRICGKLKVRNVAAPGRHLNHCKPSLVQMFCPAMHATLCPCPNDDRSPQHLPSAECRSKSRRLYCSSWTAGRCKRSNS